MGPGSEQLHSHHNQLHYILGPTGHPTNVTAVAGVTTISLTWEELECSERNSRISRYLVTYGSEHAMNVTWTMVQLAGLMPATDYNISLAAVNVDGEIGPAYTETIRTLKLSTPMTESNQYIGLNSRCSWQALPVLPPSCPTLSPSRPAFSPSRPALSPSHPALSSIVDALLSMACNFRWQLLYKHFFLSAKFGSYIAGAVGGLVVLLLLVCSIALCHAIRRHQLKQ